MAKRSRTLPCPRCKKPVQWKDAQFPFCSERCRLLDLGKWASGEYVVSSPITDPDSAEGLDPRARKKTDPESARHDGRGQDSH